MSCVFTSVFDEKRNLKKAGMIGLDQSRRLIDYYVRNDDFSKR